MKGASSPENPRQNGLTMTKITMTIMSTVGT